MDAPSAELIRVFEHDPDLLEGLDDATATHLRARVAVRRLGVERGRWVPQFTDEEVRGHLGLLVLDGLMVRTLRLAGRECSEVLGQGDLIRPWDREGSSGLVTQESAWRVLTPVSLAALDARFALAIGRWPTIMAELLGRSTRRCRGLVFQATVAQVRHAETRVLLVLWNLAERWGRVTPRGVTVPVALTHQVLAHLSCLQRPTVSSTLGHLEASGAVERLPGGGWLLMGEPPAAPGEGHDGGTRHHVVAA